MDRVDALLHEYEKQLALPWKDDLAGPQRVWMVVYEPNLERRIRLRLPEFEMATRRASCEWTQVDLTRSFSTWMATHEYREQYFREPDLIQLALADFSAQLAKKVGDVLRSANERNVVALFGVAALFPMARVSELIQSVAHEIKGRLLLFFPGSLEGSNYRLLDARDGWNYLAIPITVPPGSPS